MTDDCPLPSRFETAAREETCVIRKAIHGIDSTTERRVASDSASGGQT